MAVMGIPTIDDVRARLEQALSREPDVLVAYLFGSVARGEQDALSDVDVAVLLEPGAEHTGRRRLELDRLVAESLDRDRVDVVILNAAPPKLAYRVSRDGIRILSKDERVRLAFEVKAIDVYLDMQPFYEAQDSALDGRIRSGKYGRPPGRS